MTAADSFPLPRAELIALFLESLIFGSFAVLYAISIWILLYRERRHGRSKLNKWMFATATVMFVLSVGHLAFDVQRAVDGFVVHGGTPRGTLDFYNRLSNPTHVGKSVLYITQTLVGDTFVTYRLYIVWGRNRLITVLPILLLLGTAVSGYGICVELTKIKGSGAIFEGNLAPWITSFFALSLTTNVLATLLITGRIIWQNNKVRNYRAGYAAVTYWGVIETIIQSAAIYSAALISLLATYVSGSNAQYVCLDALQPLIGVVFSLIIIRVGLSSTTNESTEPHRHPAPSDTRLSGAVPGQFPMRPLAINVSVSKTHDRTSFEAYDQKEVSVIKDSDIESGRGSTPEGFMRSS
ncbi:hypothetical protein C8Q79DRAFT_423466 [Trametes meyenii]|nr:hypothetical protein C8Q79DRAFT_423466 [Trametes meyenii]